jgi:hypothetical protein
LEGNLNHSFKYNPYISVVKARVNPKSQGKIKIKIDMLNLLFYYFSQRKLFYERK